VYRNGYKTRKPPPPDYVPYALNQRHLKQAAFAVPSAGRLKPHKPLTESQWNVIARESGEITAFQSLRPHQWECANRVISRAGDTVLIAPTGSGKSKVYSLPLRVHKKAVAIVVVPYTSLGLEGSAAVKRLGLNSIFLYAENRSDAQLAYAASCEGLIIYVCPEMLESPTFARVIHTAGFSERLVALFLDEIHLGKESRDWRPSYQRIFRIRPIVGMDVPLVLLSATLPESYRAHFMSEIGLSADYKLINLGNFRPELSTVILRIEHPLTSFLDLAFLLPHGSTPASLRQLPTLIYCDDCDMLTSMFWWFQERLASLHLSTDFVDILHAGLSDEHASKSLADFRTHKVVFLLGSEKIGPGIDMPGVARVVQYKMRDLSLVRAAQRAGRGARARGERSTTYFLFEPSMIPKEADASDADLQSQDPYVLQLALAATSNVCCDDIFESGLENPPARQVASQGCIVLLDMPSTASSWT
ncbi:P-loop containing nucleoside triphosphate hydrolase protein, partial [Roridomyces roridus]